MRKGVEGEKGCKVDLLELSVDQRKGGEKYSKEWNSLSKGIEARKWMEY